MNDIPFEIKEAEWTHWTDDFRDYVKCSNCGFGDEGEIYLGDEPVICPCCEAKMKGGSQWITIIYMFLKRQTMKEDT